MQMKQNDTIIEALKQTDDAMRVESTVDAAAMANVIGARIEKRARIRNNVTIVSIAAAAACLVLWQNSLQKKRMAEEVANIRAESKQLVAQSQLLASMAINLNKEAKDKEEINQLRSELAEIHEAIDSYQRQQEAIVYKMLYRADRLAESEGSIGSAMEVYGSLIKYFPESKYAETAKQRLENLQDERSKQNMKG